jgi:HprK-related kinase B
VTPVAALAREVPAAFAFSVRFVDVSIRVQTNDAHVGASLRQYFAPWVTPGDGGPSAVVTLIQGAPPTEGRFVDVARGEGKAVKEAVRQDAHGRLILKRRTGVLMELARGRAVAVGDLRANLNQAINLINACYAKVVTDRGYLLLHASAVARGEHVVALAGIPGAGKSTAALHLVEAGLRFVSNDRLLVRPLADGVDALGYPKQPRVNPGTVLHHPRLAARLEPEERKGLARMDPAALWSLERKCDVDLDALYGRGTMVLRGWMRTLVLLRWTLGGSGFDVRPLSGIAALTHRALFAKNLGVFDIDRPPGPSRHPESPARYAALLDRVQVLDVTGRPNFDALVRVIRDLGHGWSRPA